MAEDNELSPSPHPHSTAHHPEGPAPRSSAETAHHYGEQYYSNYGDGLGYVRCTTWLTLFATLADRLVAHLRPGTALDAGCAKGFLVESLRDRSVDARGIDLSPYAISDVREDIKPYCRVGSLTEPLGGPYDLVTCIEVMEHIPKAEEALVFQRLTESTDAIFFSSTPEHEDDPSHYNVRPMRYWLERFAAHGFYPDASFDPQFAYQAYLLRRRKPDENAFLDAYSALLNLRQQYTQLTTATGLSSHNLNLLDEFRDPDGNEAPGQRTTLYAHTLEMRKRMAEIENSVGWRIVNGYRTWLQNAVKTRSLLGRVIEPVARRITLWMAGGTRPSAR